MINKFDKIQILRDFNLNTENSILIQDKQPNPFNSDVSIRTQWPYKTVKKTPHYPVVRKKDFIESRDELLEIGVELIVAECIDPKDCKFAGCILKDGSEMIIEIADGPGTVRRVTHDYLIDRRYIISSFFPHTNDPEVNDIILEVYKVDREYDLPDSYIFEFSYYNIPVGYKHTNIVFWEFYEV